jgi:hypothetical protein
VIYGPPPGFDAKGIMRELLFELKECEKELYDANRFTPSHNMERCNMPLPLLNGYYKQATPPKASLYSESLENLINKNMEYMQNGCKLFHLEYDPADNKRMEPVWTQFIELGRSKLFLGLHSKVFVLPAPGQQDPNQITLIQRYMKFQCRYSGVS